uniref:Uncharacterized protein n=1 Tax=Anguilla anguilla TaxID=7936 RepID=A0A0E9RQA7_ANGAN
MCKQNPGRKAQTSHGFSSSVAEEQRLTDTTVGFCADSDIRSCGEDLFQRHTSAE